jgi:hypothetical protein
MKKFKIRKSPIPYNVIVQGGEPSDLRLLQEKWHKKGYELVNITGLLEVRLGRSGTCGSLEDYGEEIYHVQLMYYGETIANLSPTSLQIIDEDKHVGFVTNTDDPMGSDFIVFRKVKIE